MKMSVADKRIKLLREDFEREGETDKAKAKFIKELQLMKREAEADCTTPLEILDAREKECKNHLDYLDREMEKLDRDGKIANIAFICFLIAMGVIALLVWVKVVIR